jgi:hypothetical protein
LPDLLTTEALLLQQRPGLRDSGIETLPYAAAVAAAAAAGPVPAGYTQACSSSSSTGGCGGIGLSKELGEYTAEADIVRRQTGLLVQLMQPVPGNAGSADAVLVGGLLQELDEDLEAARQLLCLQVKPHTVQSVQAVLNAYVHALQLFHCICWRSI